MTRPEWLRGEAGAYRFAVLLMVASSVGFSLNGLVVRSLEAADPWQVLFWRGLGVAVSQFVLLAAIHRRAVISEFRRIGRWGLVAALLNGCSPAGFFFALANTTVANVVFLLSAMPFVSALMARVLIKERIPRRTVLAIPVAFVGIAVMVSGSVAAGAWLGNLFALITVLGFSAFVVILRYNRSRNMLPLLVLGGLVAMIFSAVMTGGAVMASAHDIVLCLMLGCVITGLGHLMFIKAAQVLAAGEITFLMLIEFVLAPVWVWIFVDEVPRATTLVGGAIVLATISVWSYGRLREARA